MVYITLYDYLGTYLAVRKAIVVTENKINTAKKYDTPCCAMETHQKKGLFILFCLESISCYNDNMDKMLSVAKRFAKKCGDCSVTPAEIETFMDTELGRLLMKKSKLGGYLLKQNGSWLLLQNGYKIIL
jgi:hypothetical protein